MKKSLTIITCLALVFMSFNTVLAENKPIIIKYAYYIPSTSSSAEAIKYFAEEVEKRTGGRVKVKIYWSQSLVKFKDAIDAVGTGLADAAAIAPAYAPAKLPLASVASAPFCMKNYYTGHTAFVDLYNDSDYSALRDEFKGANMVLLSSFAGSSIDFIAKNPINGVDDLKGIKIRSPAFPYNDLYSNLGWIPVSVSWPSVYEALMRGTIGAATTYPNSSIEFKFVEVAKHHTNNRFGNSGGGCEVINLKLFNSLPDDIQKIIKQIGAESIKVQAEVFDEAVENAFLEMEKLGVTFHRWSDEEVKKMMDAVAPATDKFLSSLEKKGHPAKETFKRFQQHQAKYLK